MAGQKKKKLKLNKQRQIWVLGISVSFPTELGRLWDQTEVVIQLFSQTTWLWKVRKRQQWRTLASYSCIKRPDGGFEEWSESVQRRQHRADSPLDPLRIIISNIYWQNSSLLSTCSTKKQPLLFRGYKCKQYLIWRPRGSEFFHWNAQMTKEFPLIVPRYPWEL